MASDRHDFKELMAPAAAAKKLHISVAALRKYSLMIEKVTTNKNYYQRTKQEMRLYSKKDLTDLAILHDLIVKDNLTVEEAARQVYLVNNKKAEAPDREAAQGKPAQIQEMMQLLQSLQQTIIAQSKVIASLQAQLERVEQKNTTDAVLPDEVKPTSTTAVPEIFDSAAKTKSKADQPSEKSKKTPPAQKIEKSSEEVHAEILSKVKENAQKRGPGVEYRTLADMQLPKEKHWWQKLLDH
ncbi:transcriptional regulator [Lactobacillus sp. ESL0791]|uniref:transcriptional regulator n=1 Tax=Lactobacillus sp. ESL0791 TaxID=2983234 RepID=UPI0023FA4697|nr:transcriptional regulator [Lactobacillus sp. ESL0791]MDF7638150.1 transcriptional regulator [Lactobacillus sp. ESL0791]